MLLWGMSETLCYQEVHVNFGVYLKLYYQEVLFVMKLEI